MTELTANQCRYLAVERVRAEEAVEKAAELIAVAERTGDKTRLRVWTEKRDEARQRAEALRATYQAGGCREILDAETERAEAERRPKG
jgi:hypothetical protein